MLGNIPQIKKKMEKGVANTQKSFYKRWIKFLNDK